MAQTLTLSLTIGPLNPNSQILIVTLNVLITITLNYTHTLP